MNPPPLPKSSGKNFARQAALFSLLAPLFVIFVGIISRAIPPDSPFSRIFLFIGGGIGLLLLPAGLIMGILGLCGIREHGPEGILGKGTVGVAINGLLLLATAVFISTTVINKRIHSIQIANNLKTTEQEMQANARQSYNPRTGITNADFKSLEKMQNQLNNAEQTLSGDDALIAGAMSRYVSRMQAGVKKYHDAAMELQAVQVLNSENLTNKAQIAVRRNVVQNFMTANEELNAIVTNSEASIRADLAGLKISPEKIDSVMIGFDSKFEPRRDLDVQIRECDKQMGEATLHILNLLESDWGKWQYDAALRQIYFDNPDSRQIYRQSLGTIRFASQEQIALQGRLVKLP